MDTILELKNITKEYPGVTALDDVSVSFIKGEIHALVGENGAGKSTMIKTMTGAITPTKGKIIVEGQEFSGLNTQQAMKLGISAVYQEMIQMDAMTVADNIFIAEYSKEGLFVNSASKEKKAAELLSHFGASIDPSAPIGSLSMACRQIVEISKALSQHAKIVIFDEPTASLTMEEQEQLFKIIRNLKEQGVTVIYISHRLDEIFALCDRVTILRDGQFVKTVGIEEITKQDLINLMVGRELTTIYPEHGFGTDEVVLKVENMAGPGVNGVSFELHKGEILGFGGLVGAGRTELMHLIYGATKKTSGKVIMNGKEQRIYNPHTAMRLGIGLIPEDRKGQGCFLDQMISWNISITNIKGISNLTFVNSKKETDLANDYSKKLKIKTPSIEQLPRNLSGGNQQKVVLAKVLAGSCDIIIFDEPTRGIDVGARHEIYNLMTELAQQGKSIIMVSSDMEELLGMSDRILVLHEGDYAGEVLKDDFSQEIVLQLASGM